MVTSCHTVRDCIPLPVGGGSFDVQVQRQDSYRIHIVPDMPQTIETLITELNGRKAVVITDETVDALHGAQLTGALAARGALLGDISVPAGEQSKSLEVAFHLLDRLAQLGLARRDVLVAFGGGMVVDLVGWVASAYMRGVPYINLPSTLLAQVDAGIGGKVAVDHAAAKNLVGAFYQPRAVISCLAYLDTLDVRHIRSGLAEVIKKAVIGSPQLFEFIERSADDLVCRRRPAVETLVRAASAIKCELVGKDPYEVDLRRPLNFGHTVGHAVETVTGYGPVLHGEAVAYGMAVAIGIARERGYLQEDLAHRIVSVISQLGLPVWLEQLPGEPRVDDIVAALTKIREIRDGSLRFVLPVELGTTVIAEDVEDDEVREALLGTFAVDLAERGPCLCSGQ